MARNRGLGHHGRNIARHRFHWLRRGMSFVGGLLSKLKFISSLNDTKSNLTAGAVSRVSGATYIDTSGVLQTVNGNRTNLITYSEQFNNGWNKTRSNVSVDV